ncbi:MAG: AMP-binding protein, partial [Chloroflexota bacterium]
MTRTINEGDLLWQPAPDDIDNANITHYIRWLAANRNLHVDDYHALWRWSVTEVGPFWDSLRDYFGLVFHDEPQTPLASSQMPGADWFPGATLNYAENIFARMKANDVVIAAANEQGMQPGMDKTALEAAVARMAESLRNMGVQKGDRVAAYMPNIPEALVALLATASIGAIWTSCAPDFGAVAVLERFRQVEPKVLFAVDGYHYNGKAYARVDVVADLQAALPTLEKTVLLPVIGADASTLQNTATFD